MCIKLVGLKKAPQQVFFNMVDEEETEYCLMEFEFCLESFKVYVASVVFKGAFYRCDKMLCNKM